MLGWWVQQKIMNEPPKPEDIFKVAYMVCYLLLCMYYIPAIVMSFYTY